MLSKGRLLLFVCVMEEKVSVVSEVQIDKLIIIWI